MRDPFVIDSPTCISFSGGRTSAYMLRRVLDANSGLPEQCVVCFANTGKEEEETLRFVRECERQWNVQIVWVEYRADAPGYAVVNFDTASRNGEPFEAIIRKRNYLPNPVTRFCTVELKIRTMHKHLKSLGWRDGDGWDQMIGIRADEQRRVVKIRARPSPETVKETMIMPLADAGVTVQDVIAYWDASPFDLALPTYKGRTLAGNCDLCFLKPAGQVLSLIQQRPSRAVWWAKQEAYAAANFKSNKMHGPGTGWFFNMGKPSYAQMLANVNDQSTLFDPNEEAIACFCGE